MEQMEKTFLIYLYDRLKDIQHEKKITNYRLGKLSGVSASSLSEYDKRNKVAGTKVLCKLASALKVDINDYLESKKNYE